MSVRWGYECPNGHGALVRTKTTCHDLDDQCECETIDSCPTCGYQHFEMCATVTPSQFGEPHDGDTWGPEVPPQRYDATRGGWFYRDEAPSA